MDNLTHTLVGLTLVRAGLGRRTPGATAVMLIATNAPDLDIVTAFTGGAVPYLAAHRGWTHGPLGLAACGLAAAALVSMIVRRRREPERRASFGALAGIGLAGALLHVLMDLPTSYGTRVLAPFDPTWFAFDWLPIIDIYIWGMLIAGVIAARLAPARTMMIARLVLAGVLSFYALRAGAHGQALARAAATAADGVAAPCLSAPVLTRHSGLAPGAAPSVDAGHSTRTCAEAAAIPTFFSPFRWTLIRRHADGYELRDASLLTRERGPMLRVSSDPQAGADAAERADTARVFLAFSRMPAIESAPLPDGGRRVRFTDVRFLRGPFGFPTDAQARAPFVATVVLSPAGAVVRQRLGD